MLTLTSIAELPRTPAVYAMYGGTGPGLYVAYVGVAGSLHRRIDRHLVRRSSSVTAGTSAAMLNPDKITLLRWWEHVRFSERGFLEAAELVAFEVLQPTLRSRGAIRRESQLLFDQPDVKQELSLLFQSDPAGELIIRTLEDAFRRMDEFERRLVSLEKAVNRD